MFCNYFYHRRYGPPLPLSSYPSLSDATENKLYSRQDYYPRAADLNSFYPNLNPIEWGYIQTQISDTDDGGIRRTRDVHSISKSKLDS
ncbi:unnamed protein product [Macrosiphum euphorbiae]|uniref:Uncharacterized protein n=1 Tax=Macrosiphum euphorbiae TaxID=13131 RepID=A0AAV0XIF6_9HEMI|nr:unnamed protein product [Macrosiphum euphorbiae]